jgi:hypothetical protein
MTSKAIRKQLPGKKKKKSPHKKVTFLVINKRMLVPEPPALYKYPGMLLPFKPRKAIHLHEIMDILLVCESSARRVMHEIRQLPGRPKRPYISVKDFCQHIGIEESEIQNYFLHMEAYELNEKIFARRKRWEANNDHL